MGEFSIFHRLVVLAVVLIFFGGRRPEVMKGVGEGMIRETPALIFFAAETFFVTLSSFL